MVTALLRALGDLSRQLARASGRAPWREDLRVLPLALRWALPWAVLGRVSRDASPVRWLERQARKRPADLALSTAHASWTFAELRDEVQRQADELQARGVMVGARVAVLLPNDAALVVALLACWWLGAAPAPLDPSSHSTTLDEILERLEPDWLLIGADTVPLSAYASRCVPFSVTGTSDPGAPSDARAGSPPPRPVPARIIASGLAMILPTSGTGGTLKLCRVTAGRLALSGHAMGALAHGCRRGDLIFCPLPLHHATGITVGLMPALVHGVALHLPGKFSAAQFWQDVSRRQASQLVYVGELLRIAIAKAESQSLALPHLRRLVGNGLDATTAQVVAARFPSSRVVEFYGATEAPSLLLNYHGKPGAMGRVPLRALSRFVVVRQPTAPAVEVATPRDENAPLRDENATPRDENATPRDEVAMPRDENAPLRDENAISSSPWIECRAGEVGELWIRIPRRKRPYLGDFEGYLDAHQERHVIVRDALRRGDAYYRTYDLVHYDADDFFYFVDRLGDVWRSKGHNVSTTWLANRLLEATGIDDACVTAVALDDSARRFGLAVVVTNRSDWQPGYEAVVASLRKYARPSLVQVLAELPRTATWKTTKAAWKHPHWQPAPGHLGIYVWRDRLVAVDPADWHTTRAALLRETWG